MFFSLQYSLKLSEQKLTRSPVATALIDNPLGDFTATDNTETITPPTIFWAFRTCRQPQGTSARTLSGASQRSWSAAADPFCITTKISRLSAAPGLLCGVFARLQLTSTLLSRQLKTVNPIGMVRVESVSSIGATLH